MIMAIAERIKELYRSPVYLKIVIFAFSLIHLWWFLGIDQFIFPFIVFILLIVYIFHRQNDYKKIPFILVPLFLFLMVYAVSGFFIAEKIRYFIYSYNLIQYISVTLLIFISVKTINKVRWAETIIWVLFMIILLTSVLGEICIISGRGMWFKTPLYGYIPEAFKESEFLKTAFTKNFANPAAKIFGFNYTRLQGVFIYSNSYAQALIVMIPLVFYLFCSVNLIIKGRLKYFLRAAIFFGLSLMAVNLLFTTSRSALLGILAGSLWWLLFWEKWHLRSRKHMAIVIAAISVIAMILIPVFIVYCDEILSARTGSLDNRIIIYKKTIESWLERPFLGWGATREIIDVFPEAGIRKNIAPLGSHSTYLGLLYRQGIIGLLVFLWFIAGIFHSVGKGYRRLKAHEDIRLFRLIGFASWGLIANLVQGISNMLDLVSSSFHVTGLNIAFIIIGLGLIPYSAEKKI